MMKSLHNVRVPNPVVPAHIHGEDLTAQGRVPTTLQRSISLGGEGHLGAQLAKCAQD